MFKRFDPRAPIPEPAKPAKSANPAAEEVSNISGISFPVERLSDYMTDARYKQLRSALARLSSIYPPGTFDLLTADEDSRLKTLSDELEYAYREGDDSGFRQALWNWECATRDVIEQKRSQISSP